MKSFLSENTTKGMMRLNSCELTASITATANAIACKLSSDELSMLSVILVQLGDTLATIATQRTICESKKS